MKCRCFFFLLLLGSGLAAADKSGPAWQGPDQPLYVITQNHYAEGFTPEGDTAKFGDLLAIEIYNPKTPADGQSASYSVGEHLSLFTGGQRQGEVKVEKVMPLQCDSSAAVVSAGPSVHFTKEAMALATNAKTVQPHGETQRAATPEEQKLAKKLAMNEFRKHGVPDESESHIEIDQAIVTKIAKNGGELLIGLFDVKTKGAEHEVFSISALGDSSGATGISRYHKMTDLEDGTDYEGYRFVDQLDLDGDGVDEIVVEVTGYESEEFRILKLINGVWTRVHVGGQGGC